MTMKPQFIIIGIIVFAIAATLLFQNSRGGEQAQKIPPPDPNAAYAFEHDGLRTNTAKASIPLEKILDGGPGKDGIPALTNSRFTNIAEAEKFLKDDSDGILITVGGAARFYPYNILVWHEIANDVIEGKHLVVTFCPLCGSAIVFDAEADGEAREFGVSGKLYESNLLMYDKKTESLWSQILGEAVVGDETGKKLSVYPSQVLSLGEVKKKYPGAEVLSKDTGHSRDYSVSPYGDYGANDKIYFPISVRDNRLPAKEIMYIVNVGDQSVAFKVKDLSAASVAAADADGKKITAKLIDGEIEVRGEDGAVIPGYHAMWFSWAIHHQKDGVVWTKEKQL